MAGIQRREVPYHSDLKCPVCEAGIPVVAVVEIVNGSSRHVGSAGFREKTISVQLETKVLGFKINHQCEYTKPEEK